MILIVANTANIEAKVIIAVKNEQGNRLKSTAVAVYEGSPISYIQKGEAIEIRQGQHFYMNFKIDNDNDNADE